MPLGLWFFLWPGSFSPYFWPLPSCALPSSLSQPTAFELWPYSPPDALRNRHHIARHDLTDRFVQRCRPMLGDRNSECGRPQASSVKMQRSAKRPHRSWGLIRHSPDEPWNGVEDSRRRSSPEATGRPRPTPEALRTPPFGFFLPQQNGRVHANPWSFWEC